MLDHQAKLASIAAMRPHAAIGAHGNLDPSLDGFADAGRMVIGDRFGLVEHDLRQGTRGGLGKGDHIARCCQRWHQIDPLLLHRINSFIVQPDTVLNGRDARLQRVFNANGGLGVRHTALRVRRRLVDRRANFLYRELRRRGVIRYRKHATTGAELNPVGPSTQHLARLLAHLVYAIHNAVWHIREMAHTYIYTARHISISMPTGLAEDSHGHQHAWPREHTALHRH